jgi:hypothetical protein
MVAPTSAAVSVYDSEVAPAMLVQEEPALSHRCQ